MLANSSEIKDFLDGAHHYRRDHDDRGREVVLVKAGIPLYAKFSDDPRRSNSPIYSELRITYATPELDIALIEAGIPLILTESKCQ